MLNKNGPFGLATGTKENLPYFLNIKRKFYEFQDKDKYQWLLSIKIDTEEKSEFGTITKEDDEAFTC